jgi:hypothetical protein
MVTVVPGSPANQSQNERLVVTEGVASGAIAPELEPALLARADAAIAAIARGNAQGAKAAANDLKALVNQVQAQDGKKIDNVTAAQIIARANQLIADLGH